MTSMAQPFLANIMGLGGPDLLVVLAVAMLLFGRRLPEIGKSVGRTITEFKKGLSATTEEINKAAQADPAPPAKGTPRQLPPAKTSRPVRRATTLSDEP